MSTPTGGRAGTSSRSRWPRSSCCPSCGSSSDRRRPTGGYGRWVIDLDHGWRTARLDLEPLAVAHAAELAPLLDDPRLYEFTGGTPVSAAALADRYQRLEQRR